MAYKQILQHSGKHFSPWSEVSWRGWTACCDCGLVHEEQYKAMVMKNGRIKIVNRTRRSVVETTKQRKKMKRRIVI